MSETTVIMLATLPMQRGPNGFLAALTAVCLYIVAVIGFEIADRKAASATWQQYFRAMRKLK